MSMVSVVSEVSDSSPALFLARCRAHSSNQFLLSEKTDSTSALVPAPGRDLLSEPVLQGLDASSLSKIQTTCSSVQEMKTNPSLSVIAHPMGSKNSL